MKTNFEEALRRFKEGELIIVVDDHDRENEGDLMMLAEKATTEQTAFMVRHTTGILCVAINAQRALDLQLPYMVERNQDTRKTAFTVSVDLSHGVTTGVSASERTSTIRALAEANSSPRDFVRPGHIFPLVAHRDGLMARGGHTEAGVTLANLVGATPAVLLSEIVSEDGSMARGETLANFARSHQLLIISIAEIKEYLVESPPPPKVSVPPKFPFDWAEIQLPNGSWMIATYPSLKQREQVVLKYGEDKYGEEKGVPLLRIHSECFTGDVLHSQRCDCGEQLSKSIELIERQGFGYIIYLRDHEGRGIGLTEKLKAYILQNEGLDTVDANLRLGHGIDEREWEDAISILRELDVLSVKLLTNNPDKVDIVKRAGIECQQISLSVAPNEFNARYLSTKAERLGHLGGY